MCVGVVSAVAEESPKKTENYPLEVAVRIFDCATFCDIGEMTSDRGSKCQSKVVRSIPGFIIKSVFDLRFNQLVGNSPVCAGHQ